MFYRKNVFQWEQALRVLAGVGVALAPVFSGWEPAWLYMSGGGFLAVTGIFGFCPACYMVGRKRPDFSRPDHG